MERSEATWSALVLATVDKWMDVVDKDSCFTVEDEPVNTGWAVISFSIGTFSVLPFIVSVAT